MTLTFLQVVAVLWVALGWGADNCVGRGQSQSFAFALRAYRDARARARETPGLARHYRSAHYML